MAKYKPSNEDQMVMLPISLQDQLVPGTLEHTVLFSNIVTPPVREHRAPYPYLTARC